MITVTDPDTTGLDVRVPPALASALQTVFSLAEPPGTLAAWLDAAADRLGADALAVGLDDLCTAADSRHVACVDGDRRHFHCVLDTLVVPFLLPTADPVSVRSTSPVSGAPVDLVVTRDRVDATPRTAVVSFGLATETTPLNATDTPLQAAYTRACPYINAFQSRDEYEDWATATPAAATMPLSVPQAHELARRLATPTLE